MSQKKKSSGSWQLIKMSKLSFEGPQLGLLKKQHNSKAVCHEHIIYQHDPSNLVKSFTVNQTSVLSSVGVLKTITETVPKRYQRRYFTINCATYPANIAHGLPVASIKIICTRIIATETSRTSMLVKSVGLMGSVQLGSRSWVLS